MVSTDTIDFILKKEVPKGKKVAYANYICDHRPLKEEEWRVRLTVGGGRLEYMLTKSLVFSMLPMT